MTPVLEARSLVKHFPVHRLSARGAVVHAVDDVSIALATRGITAVVGESGSGKSTLARLLARLITPTSGTLLLDGQPPGKRYASAVQLVLQDPFASLNPVHTVGYHLARPLKLHGHPVSEIPKLLERVSLSPQFAGKYPHELSGGQRQRVAIARALAVRPRVLLADEPVSMLDVSIRLGVLNLLAGVRDNEGLAVLYVTHDIASARYLGDTIAVMYAGQIIEQGPAVSVTDQPAHPYTQMLLAAAPDPDRVTGGGAVPAGGSDGERPHGAPPSLVTPPSGCRFHPRCRYAMPVCSRQAPPHTEVTPGHASACWLHAQVLPDTSGAGAGTPSPLSDNDAQAGSPGPGRTRTTADHRPRHGHSQQAGDEPAGHNGVYGNDA